MASTLNSAFLVLAFTVMSAWPLATAQRVPRTPISPVQPVPAVPIIIPTIDPIVPLPTPDPVLIPEPAPNIEPVIVPSPPVCRVRSSDECFNEALACLSARALEDNFDVEWRDGSPTIVRKFDYATDQQDNDAEDCSMDLHVCMSTAC